MHSSLRTLALASIAPVLLIITTAAHAVAPQRTFVASYGKDTDPCSLTAPCRGFQAAINAVAPSGEVVALDSAGYGAMEIHKSVSVIVPTGIHAGLSPSTGIPLPGFPGQSGVVFIDIQDTDLVVLRGLNINHQGTVTGGIEWISTHGGTVQIENSVVNGFPMEGVYVQAPASTLLIKDSIFRNNGVGIYGAEAGGSGPGPATHGVFAEHVRIENSTIGVRVLSSVSFRLSNSTIAANDNAFHVQGVTGVALLTVDHCNVLGNNEPYLLDSTNPGAADLFVAASTLIENGPGFRIGALTQTVSLGNNSAAEDFDVTLPVK